jgi:hypothetical protein
LFFIVFARIKGELEELLSNKPAFLPFSGSKPENTEGYFKGMNTKR